MNGGPTPAGPRLLADVGGTHARFAWQSGPGAAVEAPLTLRCADHASLADAAKHVLERLARSGHAAPVAGAIAIANPVEGDRVAMTNHHWAFSIAELKAALGLQRLQVLNDFSALALALPLLAPDERRQLGGGEAKPDSAIALIGPGTGLGVSGLMPDGRGGWRPIQGEGGHVTLAAGTAREQAVIERLAARHGHVSAERAVSGPGLSDLHDALRAIDRPGEPATLTAAEITTAALARQDALCVEAVSMFCAFLGSVAGNLALTLGARGGVYVGGGIVPRLGDAFDRSPFRARFEAKGRFSGWLATVPVFVVQARQSPAFLGAAAALDAPVPIAGHVA